MAVTALALVRLRNLFAVGMLSGIFSLTAAMLYVVMDAPDVAFTEAAVGAGIATVLIIATLALTSSEEKVKPKRALWPLLTVLVTGAALLYGTLDMPPYGDPTAPAQNHVSMRYIEASPDEVGTPNAVTAVLASYRGYDTLGEVVVIFTGAAGVMAILGRAARRNRTAAAAEHKDTMEQKTILRVLAKFLIPLILLFALYVQFHGDLGPGGGFQAGVIFASAFILYALIFGVDRARQVAPPWSIRIALAAGVLLYAGVGIAGLVTGGNYLDYSVLADNPLLGQHLGIGLIEFGVGMTVAAAMITIFFTFSRQER